MKTIHQSMNLTQRLKLWIFGLFFCLIPALCFGQDLPHSSASTGADGALFFSPTPGERFWHAMVYDSNRNVTVLLGDFGANGDEIWEYDGATWSLTASWEHRHDFAMAYDSARNVTVIFGGATQPNSSTIGDGATYEYDGTNVTQTVSSFSAVRPSSRLGHAMAYDASRGVVVLFGGNSGGNETWEYDGTSWIQKMPANSPSARRDHTMIYDPVRQLIVLFGGTFGGNETWEYDGDNWTEVTPSLSPSNRKWHAMVYDSGRNVIVLFDGDNRDNDTWEYDGATNTWTQNSTLTNPNARRRHAMVYDSNRNVTVMYGGENGIEFDDTWEYDGNDWTQVESVASTHTIDMNDKPDGIWNYTSIFVGQNVTVNFQSNTGNTPVQWLATDNVTINGTLNLDGQSGPYLNRTDAAAPGPGGYAGGLGGERFDVSGSYAGTPGLGPGGGAPGVTINGTAVSGTYFGNAFLQPLLGGSGGGGSGSNSTQDGSGGGAGGGAILIDSSRDITIDGAITARGGGSSIDGRSGRGSGGAIRLVADRITGTGTLRADSPSTNASDGRIRLEAYYRSFLGGNSTSSDPIASASAPVENQIPVGNEPELVIISVDGVAVANPPTGDLNSTDVVFSEAGTVDIVVNATNVPDGSTVDLNVFTSGQIIAAPSQTLVGGTVTFNVTVPAGIGHLQASSSFLPTL